LTLSRDVCAEVGMLFRGFWTLRRRFCTGPVLLLGIAVGLFYHTVTMDRDRSEFKSSQRDQRNKSSVFEYKLLLKNPERLISLLEPSQTGFVSKPKVHYFIIVLIIATTTILYYYYVINITKYIIFNNTDNIYII